MSLPMFKKKENKPEEKIPLKEVRHVIAIAAGKGGVGKSTVTVNLGLALHHLGYRVGILDSDVYGPSLRKMLPEETPPRQNGKEIIPALCHGIRMISMAYFRREDKASVVRAPIANGIITQFIQDVSWGQLDYLLIDFPPGTGDIQLTLAQRAGLTAALMVTTPQEVAIMDVRKAMNMFNQVQIPIIGIVENMSYYQPPNQEEKIYLFGKEGGRRLAQNSGAAFLGEIPVDQEICHCTDSGEPLIHKNHTPLHPSAQAFLSLANQLTEELRVLKALSNGALQNFELTWKEMPPR